MFGSISFGVASSLVGFITDWTNDMNAIFYVYAVSAVCFITVAGSTQFKPERMEPPIFNRFTNTATTGLRYNYSNSVASTSTKAPLMPPRRASASTATRDNDEDTLRTNKIKQFHLDYDNILGYATEDDGEEESSQVRQNEIQRLIQFATESSIIEAVNLSNPPASRRRQSIVESDSIAAAREPSNVLEYIRQPQVLLFFCTMMLMGASLNMVISFLFIFLKQDLGASSSVVGLTGLVGSVTELLFFFYSRDVSKRISFT